MASKDRYAALKQYIKDYTEKHTKTPEMARAALIREGIYTEAGELKPEFGGPDIEQPKVAKRRPMR